MVIGVPNTSSARVLTFFLCFILLSECCIVSEGNKCEFQFHYLFNMSQNDNISFDIFMALFEVHETEKKKKYIRDQDGKNVWPLDRPWISLTALSFMGCGLVGCIFSFLKVLIFRCCHSVLTSCTHDRSKFRVIFFLFKGCSRF